MLTRHDRSQGRGPSGCQTHSGSPGGLLQLYGQRCARVSRSALPVTTIVEAQICIRIRASAPHVPEGSTWT